MLAALGKQMSKLLPLGIQVALGCGVRFHFAGHALDHLNSSSFDGGNLLRIVGEQANLLQSEGFQDFAGKLELAMVCLEAEALVGLDGVKSFILQLVGLELGHQADSTTFLLLIDQDARAGLGDHLQGHLQLLTAVAAERAKHITGETLGMDADERWLGMDVTVDKSYSLFPSRIGSCAAFEAHNAKVAPACGKISLGNFAD